MKKKLLTIIFIISYLTFLLISWVFKLTPGIEISKNFYEFIISMLKVLPFAFILIGLFEVWIKRETIEKHFGTSSGLSGYIWAIILASTTVGGVYVAFPIAYSLYKKGAKLSIVLTYIGSAALTRIPMTIFEATFLGLKFSIIRLLVSIPLVIVSSILIGNIYKNKEVNH